MTVGDYGQDYLTKHEELHYQSWQNVLHTIKSIHIVVDVVVDITSARRNDFYDISYCSISRRHTSLTILA